MNNYNKENHSLELAEHFFRNEYGKLVSVITGYLGTENVHTAEDIVQETLLKAVDYWQHNGIPENPQAWLYRTAKNLTLNILKKNKQHTVFRTERKRNALFSEDLENLEISEATISDDQLKMMFVCCHPSISENSQIALILKILCGFSITEIANAFFTTKEVINKRLVRGRKHMRKLEVNFEIPENLHERIPVVLKTIFLLFNEGYSPTQKDEIVRFDLCAEAIRLSEILVQSSLISEKSDCYAILALMYLNASRFESRKSDTNTIVEMEMQDRSTWNQELINKGIQNLNHAIATNHVSTYLILATISANHCIAPSFEETNWNEILSLYDSLIGLNDTPIVRLNRSVVVAKVKGNRKAIAELETLENDSDIDKNHLFHSTLAELHKLENNIESARDRFKKAISLTKNIRDIKLLEKKLIDFVPIS